MVSELTSTSKILTIEEHTHEATVSAFHLTADEVENVSSHSDKLPQPHFRTGTRVF